MLKRQPKPSCSFPHQLHGNHSDFPGKIVRQVFWRGFHVPLHGSMAAAYSPDPLELVTHQEGTEATVVLTPELE